MAAPIGNNYWKLAEYPGRPRKYDKAEELWTKAVEYFEWCDATPWLKHEAIKSGDLAGTTMAVETQRPYLLSGLQLFLGITDQTWNNYKANQTDKEFLEVIKVCEEIIRTQKLEGAIVGTFNANIIARDLGLVEKQDRTTNGESINQHKVIFEDNSKK